MIAPPTKEQPKTIGMQAGCNSKVAAKHGICYACFILYTYGHPSIFPSTVWQHDAYFTWPSSDVLFFFYENASPGVRCTLSHWILVFYVYNTDWDFFLYLSMYVFVFPCIMHQCFFPETKNEWRQKFKGLIFSSTHTMFIPISVGFFPTICQFPPLDQGGWDF